MHARQNRRCSEARASEQKQVEHSECLRVGSQPAMEPPLHAPPSRNTAPRGRRSYAMTAPPSLTGKKGDTLKRGAPTIWELQESMAAHAAREASEGAEGVHMPSGLSLSEI